ncbi:MAG: DUF6717 family protein [Candidatus Parabeggiatoa sp.]|nr:DUF6717 family protein [Candidatus Parabeggiatoa sp.]
MANSNSIMVIFPYRYQDIWMFDDEKVGLVQEPFVEGMPEIIDLFVQNMPNAEQGFKLFFSATPFPSYQAELVWVREECGGNWYRWETHQLEGWLCPALFKYFPEAPQYIYCKAEQSCAIDG